MKRSLEQTSSSRADKRRRLLTRRSKGEAHPDGATREIVISFSHFLPREELLLEKRFLMQPNALPKARFRILAAPPAHHVSSESYLFPYGYSSLLNERFMMQLNALPKARFR